jgi:Tsp45I type II restriction enzyme.
MSKVDWIQKSLQIVNGEGYLQKLTKVYPINENSFRDVDMEIIEKIKDSYNKRDPKGVVEHCLRLEKFPIDNPYISMLRNSSIFEKNLEVVRIIGNILLTMDMKDLETLIRSPKSGSRQFGNSFKSWLKTKYEDDYFLSVDEFKNNKSKELKFLAGSDKTLKDFISNNFGLNTEKGLDLVFKKNDKTYIGEAKFITDSGGTQTNQLNVALEIAKKDGNKIGSIAIIDGVPWINDSYFEKIRQVPNKNVLTALLLPDYLSNL